MTRMRKMTMMMIMKMVMFKMQKMMMMPNRDKTMIKIMMGMKMTRMIDLNFHSCYY